MKILVDTHIALWYLNGDERLPLKARNLIDDAQNEIYFSIVSMWEIEIKHIAHPDKMINSGLDVLSKCRKFGFLELALKDVHVDFLHTLHRAENAPKHNDPFDRMLLSQAKAEGLVFLTHDLLISDYNESCAISV